MWIDNGHQLLNTDRYRKIVVSDKCVLGVVSKGDYDLIKSYNTDQEAEDARIDIFDHLRNCHPVMRIYK